MAETDLREALLDLVKAASDYLRSQKEDRFVHERAHAENWLYVKIDEAKKLLGHR